MSRGEIASLNNRVDLLRTTTAIIETKYKKMIEKEGWKGYKSDNTMKTQRNINTTDGGG